MRLDIRFSNRPLEDLWCQAVTALVFKDPVLMGGMLFGLNEKMIGTLAGILEKGWWTGDRGENYLIATQDMIKADKLLFRGLGPKSEFNIESLEKEIIVLGMTLDKMGVNEFGISIPVAGTQEKEYINYLNLSAKKIPEVFLENHKHDPDYVLKIIFSVEHYFLAELGSLIDSLRDYFRPITDASIIIDNKIYSDINDTKAASEN